MSQNREDTMGRRPIGDRPMTDAERQRRSRAKTDAQHEAWMAGHLANMPWTPWATYLEIVGVNELKYWLEIGPREEVAKWLATHISKRDDQKALLDRLQSHLKT